MKPAVKGKRKTPFDLVRALEERVRRLEAAAQAGLDTPLGEDPLDFEEDDEHALPKE